MAALERSLAEAKGEERPARDGAATAPSSRLSREELYESAQEADVPGRSSMSQGESSSTRSAAEGEARPADGVERLQHPAGDGALLGDR